MASDTGEILERSYRLRHGCGAMGCAMLFVIAIGGGAAAGVSHGCEKIQNGQGWQLALGWAMVVVCGLALPLLLLAPIMLILAIKEVLRPDYLRVTPMGLLLPLRLRGTQPRVENDEEEPEAPALQPEEIPFAAIRWIRREDGVGGSQLLIVHDLSATTLILQTQSLDRADFEELETILKTAIPAAFTAAPPKDAKRG